MANSSRGSTICQAILALFIFAIVLFAGLPNANDVADTNLEVTALIFGKKEITLKAKTQGELVEIKADEGQSVNAKDVIAVLDSRQKKIDVLKEEAEYEMALQDFNKTKKLGKYLSKDEIQQKEANYLKKKATYELKQLELANTRITAP